MRGPRCCSKKKGGIDRWVGLSGGRGSDSSFAGLCCSANQRGLAVTKKERRSGGLSQVVVII